MQPLLEVRRLTAVYPTRRGLVRAVDDVSLSVAPGEAVGVVGESGSGKTTLLRSVLRLLVPPGRVVNGQVLFRGRDLLQLPEAELRAVRGGQIGMVFQDPVNAFNPALTIGQQLRRVLKLHRPSAPGDGYDAEILRALRHVGLDARGKLNAYPFMFSQGQLQRSMIAAACLGGQPGLLLADEPTTSLDVTIEAQVLHLLRTLRHELGLALVLVTHNLALVAELCDRVVVMNGGRLVEEGDVYSVFDRPRHAYTAQLVRAIPMFPHDGARAPATERSLPLVAARGLRQHFSVSHGPLGPRRWVRAVDGVDLEIRRGEVMGLIGESGSGKTTFGRTLLQLYTPTGGRIEVDGQDVTYTTGGALRTLRRRMQMVFQNPYAAVNRRKTIGQVLAEPLEVHGVGSAATHAARVRELIGLVGLGEELLPRYPHELSGGQLQRVGVARALALEPDFVVADEPTASLDVSIRRQVIDLLADLKARLGLTLLFISHDLSIVSYLADRVAVMYLGRVVESGPIREVERMPLHPYTRALLSSIPRADPRQRRELGLPLGEIPNALDPPRGCHYHPRCPLAMPICREEYPPLEDKTPGHSAACHAVPAEPSVASAPAAR